MQRERHNRREYCRSQLTAKKVHAVKVDVIDELEDDGAHVVEGVEHVPREHAALRVGGGEGRPFKTWHTTLLQVFRVSPIARDRTTYIIGAAGEIVDHPREDVGVLEFQRVLRRLSATRRPRCACHADLSAVCSACGSGFWETLLPALIPLIWEDLEEERHGRGDVRACDRLGVGRRRFFLDLRGALEGKRSSESLEFG